MCMVVDRLNCWEFMGCGKEDCPARTNELYSGINNGINGGRVCWAIVGTMCREKVERDLSVKYDDCVECLFFNQVHIEEDKNFTVFEEVYKRGLLDNKNFGHIAKKTQG